MQQHFHYIEPYNPIFYDGWAPTLEQVDTRSEISRLGVISAQQQTAQQTAQQAAALANQRRMQQQPSTLSNYSNQMPMQVQQNLTSRSQKANMVPQQHQQQQLSVDTNDGADDESRRWALSLLYKGAK